MGTFLHGVDELLHLLEGVGLLEVQAFDINGPLQSVLIY